MGKDLGIRFGTTHWLSPQYPDDYVTSLRAQFRRRGHDLTVLGNGADYDRPLQMPERFTGWWSKLEWFAPWNKDLRPAIVFDLDTYIVGELGPFLSLDVSDMWLIREFLGNKARGESGIFLVPDTKLADVIWNRAQGHDPRGMDGALLRQFPHRYLPDEVDGIYSYKAHGLRGGYPDDARVICFHGRPKPPNTDGWALQWWQTSLAFQTPNS